MAISIKPTSSTLLPRLGQIPEGCASILLPTASPIREMLLLGRVLTAQECVTLGLVTQAFFPGRLMEEAIPRCCLQACSLSLALFLLLSFSCSLALSLSRSLALSLPGSLALSLSRSSYIGRMRRATGDALGPGLQWNKMLLKQNQKLQVNYQSLFVDTLYFPGRECYRWRDRAFERDVELKRVPCEPGKFCKLGKVPSVPEACLELGQRLRSLEIPKVSC